MPIREASGGAWVGPTAAGNFRLKWGGSSWYYPSIVYVKTSDGAANGVAEVTNNGFGANPRWVDTGYRGYPAVPASLWVHAWSYSAIALGWSAGSGGAPVSAWHLVQTDVNGNWINQVEVGGSPWGNFAMNWDTRYQFYVRAKGASGLYSAFYGPLRVGCGHPRQDTYGYVQRTRAWQSAVIGGGKNKDDPFWVSVPPSVLINALRARNMYFGSATSLVSGTATRTVNSILASADFGSIGNYAQNSNLDVGLNNWGNNDLWGLVARGTGWSTTGNGAYQLWISQLWVDGTEYYQNYEIVSTIPEQGNYYW